MERRKRKTAVTIPAGVQGGMQVRLTGEGDVGRNSGPAGNLYIQVDVRNHELFTREDSDLFYRLPVDMAEAALGVEKEVPTLDGGMETIKVPQGTQPGSEFRIRGKGVPHLNSSRRGDLRVLVDLQVPRNLNAHQRKLLEELANSLAVNGRGKEPPEEDGDDEDDSDKGLFDRLKGAFS